MTRFTRGHDGGAALLLALATAAAFVVAVVLSRADGTVSSASLPHTVRGQPASTGHAAGNQSALSRVSVSERTARRLGIREGDLLEMSADVAGPWRRVRVERIYRPVLYPSEVAEQGVDIRLHLPDLQTLTGAGDEVDSIVVRLRDPDRSPDTAARLNTLALGYRAYTSADLAARNSSTFEVIARFHRAISAVAILASSVFLLTIMTLRGEELRQQVGLMRLVGISPRSVAAAILLIAAGVALLGSGIGIGIGAVLSTAINVYYRRLFDTDLLFSQVTPGLLVATSALSVTLGIAAGGLTAWRLLRRPPLDQIGR
jgi:putative ABC transport system permease protein